MEVPRGQAVQVSGVGFGAVFASLIILAIVIWLTGLVLSKISVGSKGEADTKTKGD